MVIITDRELRRLSRKDLVEIIYQYQEREQELMSENKKLQEALEDRRLHAKEIGSIAEASLVVNGVFEAAQAAADQYMENVQRLGEEYLENLKKKAIPDEG